MTRYCAPIVLSLTSEMHENLTQINSSILKKHVEDQASAARHVLKQAHAIKRLWINPRNQELIQKPQNNTAIHSL